MTARPTIVAPVPVISSYPEREAPIAWAVPRLMVCPGRPAIALGRDGIGKTLLVQTVALARQAGIAALGLVDADDPIRGFDPRRKRDWLRILDGFDLVIVDCYAALFALFGGDENLTRHARPVTDAIRGASVERRCSVMMIAHTGHVGGAGAIWLFTGSTERGVSQIVERTRDSADDDGVDAPRSFRFQIVEAAEIAVPGLFDRDGKPVPALRVERLGAGFPHGGAGAR